MDCLQTERENLVRMSKIQRAERGGGAKRGRESKNVYGFFSKKFSGLEVYLYQPDPTRNRK